jgi:hypothetical protein
MTWLWMMLTALLTKITWRDQIVKDRISSR